MLALPPLLLLPVAPLLPSTPPTPALPKSASATTEMPLALPKLLTLPCTPASPACNTASPTALRRLSMVARLMSMSFGLLAGVQPSASMAFAWPFSSTVEPFSVFLVVSVPGIDYSWNFQKFRLKETPEQPLAIQEPEKSARIIAKFP